MLLKLDKSSSCTLTVPTLGLAVHTLRELCLTDIRKKPNISILLWAIIITDA